MGEQVYLNGAFVDYEQALIPVEDRGNLFSDGVYEVIRFYGGHPFFMEAHLERLKRSSKEIRLPEIDIDELGRRGMELIRRNQVEDGTLYLQVTRGPARRDHAFPKDPKPTVFALARSVPRPDANRVEEGVTCITQEDIRWQRCDIKSVGLLPNVLAKQAAREAGAYEAIFVSGGEMIEGTSSNLFGVRDGRLITHPEGNSILPGITRRIILALAKRESIPVELGRLPLDELQQFDELFLSGTTTELQGVVQVDGKPIGDGKVGAVTRRLQASYDQLIDRVRRGETPDISV